MQDVCFVQIMLNNWIILGPLNGWVKPLTTDGICGGKTVEAIEFFQKIMIGYNKPDGRIDPWGKTIQTLTGPLTLRPEVDPSQWAKPAKPPKVEPVATYDPVEMTTAEIAKLVYGGDTEIWNGTNKVFIHSGEVWRAQDGDRLVIAGSSSPVGNVRYIQLKINTGFSRKLGWVYRQHRVGFQSDVTLGVLASDVVRRTDHIQQLMRIEMYCLMGMLSVVGGTPVLLWTIGTSIGEFVAKNKQKFPFWAAAVSAALTARTVCMKYAPTFYDKVIDAILLSAWKGTKIVLEAYGTDILGNVPEAMLKDPDKAAKAAGGMVAKLGQNAWKGKTGAVKIIITILLDVASHALKSLPVATKLKADEIITKVREAGVSISNAEGEQIVLEIVKNAAILEPELMKLKQALDKC